MPSASSHKKRPSNLTALLAEAKTKYDRSLGLGPCLRTALRAIRRLSQILDYEYHIPYSWPNLLCNAIILEKVLKVACWLILNYVSNIKENPKRAETYTTPLLLQKKILLSYPSISEVPSAAQFMGSQPYLSGKSYGNNCIAEEMEFHCSQLPFFEYHGISRRSRGSQVCLLFPMKYSMRERRSC